MGHSWADVTTGSQWSLVPDEFRRERKLILRVYLLIRLVVYLYVVRRVYYHAPTVRRPLRTAVNIIRTNTAIRNRER